MKKLFFVLVSLLIAGTAVAQPSQLNGLPMAAQQFINTYFSQWNVADIRMHKNIMQKSYNVHFTNGSKIEFNNQGQWTKIKVRDIIATPTRSATCRNASNASGNVMTSNTSAPAATSSSMLPANVVPSRIMVSIVEQYPTAALLTVQRSGKRYMLTLDNDMELIFNNMGELIKVRETREARRAQRM